MFTGTMPEGNVLKVSIKFINETKVSNKPVNGEFLCNMSLQHFLGRTKIILKGENILYTFCVSFGTHQSLACFLSTPSN